jgi:hypothetical protein
MRVTMFAALAALTLGLAGPSLAGSRQADDYFFVRDRGRIVAEFGEPDVRQSPEMFEGKLLELKGAVTGQIDTAIVVKNAAGSEMTVQLPVGKHIKDYPQLGVNYSVRLLCRVVREESSPTGALEMVIAVRDNEAAAVDNERERIRKAAEARTKKTTPVRTASRGGSTGVNSAVRAYSSQEVLRKYTDAIRYFNGRLSEGTARNIAAHIINYSNKYRLDGRLVMAVVCCESNFNPNAVSRVGAMGLGQLMPGTAGDLGVGNAFSIGENLEGSTRLLKSHILSMKAGGRPDLDAVKLALACYNAGAGAVQKYKGIPPYQETQAYVKKIIRLYWQMLPESERKGWSPD